MATRTTDEFKGERKCPVPIHKIEHSLWVTSTLTKETIPDQIQGFKNWTDKDIHLYIIKAVLLQVYYCIIGSIWVLDLNLISKSGEKKYCVAVKIDPTIKKSRNYDWKIREELYTAQQTWNLIKSLDNNYCTLPAVVMDSHDFSSKIHGIEGMEKTLNKTKHSLFWEEAWDMVPVFQNQRTREQQKRNIYQPTLPLLKNKLVKALVNTYCSTAKQNIELIPILLFDDKDKNVYFIDGLMRLELDELTIGISFRPNPQNPSNLKVSGIHASINFMKIHCKLTGRSPGNFFDGWRSNYDNIIIVNQQTWQKEKDELNELREFKKFMEMRCPYIVQEYNEKKCVKGMNDGVVKAANDIGKIKNILAAYATLSTDGTVLQTNLKELQSQAFTMAYDLSFTAQPQQPPINMNNMNDMNNVYAQYAQFNPQFNSQFNDFNPQFNSQFNHQFNPNATTQRIQPMPNVANTMQTQAALPFLHTPLPLSILPNNQIVMNVNKNSDGYVPKSKNTTPQNIRAVSGNNSNANKGRNMDRNRGRRRGRGRGRCRYKDGGRQFNQNKNDNNYIVLQSQHNKTSFNRNCKRNV